MRPGDAIVCAWNMPSLPHLLALGGERSVRRAVVAGRQDDATFEGVGAGRSSLRKAIIVGERLFDLVAFFGADPPPPRSSARSRHPRHRADRRLAGTAVGWSSTSAPLTPSASNGTCAARCSSSTPPPCRLRSWRLTGGRPRRRVTSTTPGSPGGRRARPRRPSPPCTPPGRREGSRSGKRHVARGAKPWPPLGGDICVVRPRPLAGGAALAGATSRCRARRRAAPAVARPPGWQARPPDRGGRRGRRRRPAAVTTDGSTSTAGGSSGPASASSSARVS